MNTNQVELKTGDTYTRYGIEYRVTEIQNVSESGVSFRSEPVDGGGDSATYFSHGLIQELLGGEAK